MAFPGTKTAAPPRSSSFAADGSLTIHEEPTDPVEGQGLPAPEGQFALIMRAYVPTQPILDGSYESPNVKPSMVAG